MSTTKGDNDKDDNFKRQGSFRKLLPTNVNGDSQLNMSVKMIDRPNITLTNKNYAVFLQEYNILSEYNILRTQDLKGVYVIPSAQNSLVWFGVQFIRQGIYQGGVFRFTLTLPENFPDGGCPKVVFQTHVFHPLINPETGELCTTWGFIEWKRNNRVWQLLQYVTKILTKIDTRMTPLNQEASILLQNNFDQFGERAKECVRESLNEVYNPPAFEDPHYITFSPYIPELHDPVKQQIYELKEVEGNRALGLSWVQPGSLQPFSKPESR
ncbi:PREDICTED: AKT-interacting protein-like [Polistes dominula]|uniref:AKT-interacting protein-like n=1 Tax=Polistes dominula TaxID=743375 RepID=A0ABM1HXL3_POLDO|nr:PREDICTED: AKT-interacting protein-like [Polistes dominula]